MSDWTTTVTWLDEARLRSGQVARTSWYETPVAQALPVTKRLESEPISVGEVDALIAGVRLMDVIHERTLERPRRSEDDR